MSFFVIEGLDGSGKSTQVKLIKQYFENKNIKYKYIHFPKLGDGIFGDLVAKFLRGEFGAIDHMNPYIVALLYAEDRNDSASQINQWIKDGYVVLCDRYVNSNIAFQSAKVQKQEEKDKLMNWILDLEYNYFKIPKPDFEIFLDVPNEFIEKNLTSNRTGDDRSYLDGQNDIHEESLDFQKEVRKVYLALCEKHDYLHKINCANNNDNIKEKEEILFDIIQELNSSIIQ